MTDYKFLQLKKAAKKASASKADCKMALMGDCATQHVAAAIKGYAAEVGLIIDLCDIDYNLIEAQTIDSHSLLYEFAPDYTVIYMCMEKLEAEFSACADKASFADTMYSRILEYWSRINNNIKTNILQFTFIENDDRVFGNFALKTAESFLFQVKKLNYLLSCGCQTAKNVFLIDLNSIQLENGKLRDDKLYYAAKMPIMLDMLPKVAKNVVDVVNVLRGKIKKCVICDLDNTLWGGVIGDDGLNGIQIGELGRGKAFEDFQRWLKLLKERGIILCVCSKNNEETAKEPFLKHPEMVLSLDDISVFVANWEDKASNIMFIQKTLNIGMDSIVFFDDNPFERNLVRSMIKDITVPELPEDPAMYLSYIKGLNLFETVSFSQSDKKRTEQYQAEMKRISEVKKFESYDEYLEGLDMIAEVKPFDDFQTPRIAQLTQRSNQFNLRTVRCTENDISLMASDDSYITRYFTLKDKFGDHGLISVLIMKKEDAETLFIENWLMSCRVLKRGMEEFIINSIVSIAKENGFSRIIGEYLETPKNAMVKNIYLNHGFKTIGDNRFELNTAEYQPQKTFIKE